VATFKAETPLSLDGLSRRKLGDDLEVDVGVVRVKGAHSGDAGQFSYRLTPEPAFRVELFNSENDRDKAHGVIGRLPKRKVSGNIRWYPLIDVGKSGAWLKYTTSAKIRHSAGNSLLGLKGDAEADHFYYHKHRRNKLLGTAIAQDLVQQKFAFSYHDVLSLDVSEAAGLASEGKVQLALRFDWNDILASGITRLAALLNSSETVAIQLSGRAGVEFKVSVEGGFKLVFLGLGDGDFRVALSQSDAAVFKAGLKTKFVVGFARPSEVEDILDEVVAGLLGVSPASLIAGIDALKQKTSFEQFSGLEQALLESLADRLGFDESLHSREEALDLLDGFQKKVSSAIRDIAKTRVEAGFVYEYSRLETHASLYEGDFTQAALSRLYPDILAGNFHRILADADNYPGEITTRRFLNERSLLIRHATGFSLGAGHWSLSGKESTVFKFVTQVNAEKAVRHSLLGSRKYEGKYFGPHESTFLDFKAGMPDFLPDGQDATARDFRFGLSLTLTDGRAYTSNRRLKAFLDSGLLCGVGPEGDLDRLTALVRSTFGNRKTRGKIALRLKHKAVLGFSEWLTLRSTAELGRIMARGMEYRDSYPLLRLVTGRQVVYGTFWQTALRRRLRNAGSASRFALKQLQPLDSSLYWSEKQALRGRNRDPATIYVLFRRNPDLLRDFQAMRDAFSGLHSASVKSSPFTELAEIANGLHRFANTRFKVRVMLALLSAYRNSVSIKPAEFNSAITVQSIKDKRVLTLGRKTGKR